ncbi:FecR family protein [Acidovorax sp. A1169]|uniref:FecR family protein n=1 Tax=Acidovorax sp. A1169 TaxID=3059524 RepID=UPI00273785E9|nr:FecR domain-containing protein [Acidovorax sp. A1169]MDP4074386.1 FecR domain-containing protein [Acidovorax sp. A1169]
MTPLQPPPTDDDAMHLREEVLGWFIRRDRDGWNGDDEVAFQAWLQADERHRSRYTHWQARWEAMDAIPADAVAQLRGRLARDKAVQQAYAQAGMPVVARQGEEGDEREGAGPTRRRLLVPALAMAGMAAITAGTGLLGWRQWQAQPVFTQAFSTVRGQQAEVPLPDGSRLRLGTATRLEVTYYRQRRQVRLLDGQAVFSVQADADRPFEVLAAATRITVVGTRFAVRHTPDMAVDAGVHVLVEEGRVRVARAAVAPGPGELELTAGQQVASDAQGALAAVMPVPGDGIAPWREHRVSFVDMPLGHALAEMERYGSTGLVLSDPAVAALRLSGTFDPRDTRTLRSVLPSALPVRLQEQGAVTEILPAR